MSFCGGNNNHQIFRFVACDFPCPVGTEPTGISEFAYIYDTTTQLGIPFDGEVTFNTNGNITPAGFVTHVPGTAPITINQPGTYLITYTVLAGAGAFAFALYNGNNIIAGSGIGLISSDASYSAQIITTLNASDVLTLRNINGSPVTLVSIFPIPSSSIVILRIA
ncbi:BclA C-terminal domain-containing protein [Lysinibacillus xylanilyticus]|uniref:BclA C-terminal domain-containing protein n=1 Tax=Lysinibacillus xylanilyticus TaxID=582475 RepID=UPI003818BA80